MLKMVPVISVITVKFIFNFIMTRFVFLRRGTKILALDNFRAFNVFLYFNFFFDYFMGILSAITRLLKAVVFSIIMMPRIAYSFFGRHLENMDNGYSSYMGFLYMEAAHTNPILVTFCSLLSYKGLDDHIRMLVSTKSNFNIKFTGSHDIPLPVYGKVKKLTKKKYEKHIVNKWHVIAFLMKNPILILERKSNLETKEKFKLEVRKSLCCKKESSSV
jgi:hypothetical protein